MTRKLSAYWLPIPLSSAWESSFLHLCQSVFSQSFEEIPLQICRAHSLCRSLWPANSSCPSLHELWSFSPQDCQVMFGFPVSTLWPRNVSQAVGWGSIAHLFVFFNLLSEITVLHYLFYIFWKTVFCICVGVCVLCLWAGSLHGQKLSQTVKEFFYKNIQAC